MRDDSSAFTRTAIAVTRIWQELVRVETARLARPWEAEGDLRWAGGPGGPRLIGGDVPVSQRHSGRAVRRRARQADRALELSQ